MPACARETAASAGARGIRLAGRLSAAGGGLEAKRIDRTSRLRGCEAVRNTRTRNKPLRFVAAFADEEVLLPMDEELAIGE